MTKRERIITLLNILSTGEFVSVDTLCSKLNVSAGTIRRDLIELENEHKLTRVHGGAVISSSNIIHPISQQNSDWKNHSHSRYALPYEFEKELDTERDNKILIAKKAASLIEDYDSVFIGASSTTYYMIDYIVNRNITVVTDGLPHLFKLAKRKIPCYILEGSANHDRGILILSEHSIQVLSALNFSKSFLGTLGVDFSLGCTTASIADANIKKIALDTAQQTFILADPSKYNKRSLVTFAKPEEATIIGMNVPTTNNHFKCIDITRRDNLV